MSKIICDICGTSYLLSAGRCPICGYSPDPIVSEEFAHGDEAEIRVPPMGAHVKGGRFSTSNVRKRNKGADTYQAPVADEYDEQEFDPHPRRKVNVFLVMLLVLLILALLAVAGYMFVNYYLPNAAAENKQQESAPDVTTQESSEETQPTAIACESLTLEVDTITLTAAGQYALVHPVAQPVNTTDEILYFPGDESVALVDQDGRITAVGEGTTEITVQCGDQVAVCTVICDFREETEPSEQPDPTEETESTEATESTEETDPAEQAEPTDETEETGVHVDIVLYLNTDDFTLFYRGSYYELQFNPELSAEDITWISTNENVATVKNGVVTAVGKGVAVIKAIYGDQEVTCTVRCNFGS